MPQIKLQSAEKEVFCVDVESAMCSITIRNMLNNLGTGNDEEEDEEDPIPLANIESAILKMVIDWANHHKDDPPEMDDDDDYLTNSNEIKINEKKIAIAKWDEEFIKVDRQTIYKLILAANFLDIKKLLDLGCVVIANIIKSLGTPEKIREEFNIINDFTPEEEEQVRQENKWCEES